MIQENKTSNGSLKDAKVVPLEQDSYPVERQNQSLSNKEPHGQNITAENNVQIQIPKNPNSLPGVDISFENLSYQVKINQKNKETGKKETITRDILKNVSGICKQGEVTAIMGASGAGKTSLLNIICKRVAKTKMNDISGIIKANQLEYSYENFTDFATYVMQDDRLLETLTVKECLMFAARLRVKGTPADQEARVDKIISALKLERCKDTRIGGNFLKGISGGERKRCSIAFEMVTDPKVMFLDEPTSGLDSFTAFLLINLLKQMAREGNKTIIFTIHQPNSDIWHLFDRVMLLVSGKFIYQGPGQDKCVDYFAERGFKCPITSNPSDYFMSIMHKESQENRDNYPKYFENYQNQLAPMVNLDLEQKDSNEIQKKVWLFSYCKEVTEIYKRTLIETTRNPMLFKSRFAQTIFLSLFIGAIYYQADKGEDNPVDQRAMNDYVGFFFFQSVNMLMMSMMPMVLTFPTERAVFLKEENSKLYSVSSYFTGRTVLEFPFLVFFPVLQSTIIFFMVGLRSEEEVYGQYILANVLISLTGNSLGLFVGSAFSDPKVASAMMPMFIMPFMLFGGMFTNRDSLWDGVQWIEYLSPFKYGFDAHVNNEFKESFFRPNPIETLNLEFGYWESCLLLGIMFFAYRTMAFGFLYWFKTKLQ